MLHNGRTKEAIDTLNYIAWFNGVEGRIPEDSVFLEADSEDKMISPKSTAKSRIQEVILTENRVSEMSFKGIKSFKINEDEKGAVTSQFTLAVEFIVLSLYNMMVMGLYTFAYLLIARMGGDMFVNGVVLSLGECFSAIGSGWAMTFMSDTAVTRLFIVICLIFNVIYYYVTGPDNVYLQYVVLFLAVFGQYGPVNTIFVIYEQRLPPRNLGAGTTLICLVFGPIGISPMPYVAIAP